MRISPRDLSLSAEPSQPSGIPNLDITTLIQAAPLAHASDLEVALLRDVATIEKVAGPLAFAEDLTMAQAKREGIEAPLPAIEQPTILTAILLVWHK